jgi:hypothetical protein
VRHVPGCVVAVALELVIGRGGENDVFRRAFGWCLGQQIAPGVLRVAIAPELRFAIQHGDRAVGSRVLRRHQAVERVVGEALISGSVFVVGNAPDIAVVSIAIVEVVVRLKRVALGETGMFTVCWRLLKLKLLVRSATVFNFQRTGFCWLLGTSKTLFYCDIL